MGFLLPGNWGGIPAAPNDFNSITQNRFEGRLYNSAQIKSSGVPSIFAHPYGFTKAMKQSDQMALKRFSLLTRGLFLGIIEAESIPLTDASRLTQVIKSFEPGMTNFIILKWNNKEIGGGYPDCFLYPGAKFIAASEYEDQNPPIGTHPESGYKGITLQKLEKEIDRKTKLYSPDLVKALFSKWVDEIQGIVGTNLPAGTPNPAWLDSLLDIKNNFKAPFAPPPTALNQFTFTSGTFSAQVRCAGNLIAIPMRRFEKNIFCEEIVEFSNHQIPDLPVKKEYLSMVNIAATSKERGANNEITYSVHLNNWPAPISWTPLKKADGGKASILLWPSFKAKGWNVNYAFFAPSPTSAGLSINLIKNNFNVAEQLGQNEGCQIDFPVEFIEIDRNGTPLGIFRDSRPQIGDGGQGITISLDFGTSHTTIGIEEDGNYKLLDFDDLTHDILGTDYYQTDPAMDILRRNCFWLPTTSFNRNLATLPSELLFADANLKPEGDPALKAPIKNFTIPHSQFERDNAHRMIISDFKWESPPNFTQALLIKTYIKMILHMALAAIRRNTLSTNISVVPTYPLAFGKERYDKYRKSLEGPIFNDLQQETGMTLNLAIVNTAMAFRELVAESQAAKVSWAPAPGTAELVVDIGGGTTDIALWVNGNEMMDSIRYGGNVYLNYLAEKFPQYPGGIDNLNERVIALQKKMRESGIQGLLGIYPDAIKNAAQQVIDRFFQGIFEYLYRLLSAYSVTKVQFYPVGNGWRLIEGFIPPNNRIESFIKSYFDSKEIGLTVSLPRGGDYKGVVSKGALEVASLGSYNPPDLTIPVKTINGADITVAGQKIGCNDKIPSGPLGTRPLAFDTSRFISSLPGNFRITNTNADITAVASTLNKYCERAIYMCPGGQYGINKSIFGIFLEKIYPEYYL